MTTDSETEVTSTEHDLTSGDHEPTFTSTPITTANFILNSRNSTLRPSDVINNNSDFDDGIKGRVPLVKNHPEATSEGENDISAPKMQNDFSAIFKFSFFPILIKQYWIFLYYS